LNRVSIALLNNSAVNTSPMHPTIRHHSNGSHRSATAARTARQAKKRWTQKLD
jgi:hypothetical protein